MLAGGGGVRRLWGTAKPPSCAGGRRGDVYESGVLPGFVRSMVAERGAPFPGWFRAHLSEADLRRFDRSVVMMARRFNSQGRCVGPANVRTLTEEGVLAVVQGEQKCYPVHHERRSTLPCVTVELGSAYE